MFNRLILPLLLAVAGVSALARGPKVSTPTITFHRTAAQLWVVGYFTTTGGATTVATTASVTGQATQTHPSVIGTADSFAFTPPGAGVTVTAQFCGKPFRGSVAGVQQCKSQSYTDQTPPGITIDSLKPQQTSAVFDGKTQIQFAAYTH